MIRPALLPLLTFALCALVMYGSAITHSRAETATPENTSPCQAFSQSCVIRHLEQSLAGITNQSWKDKALRDYAGSMAYMGKVSRAVDLTGKIESDDTRAMALRRIAAALAQRGGDKATLSQQMDMLVQKAAGIEAGYSRDIALTYIAIAMARAGLADLAEEVVQARIATPSLRNKAYAEMVEDLAAQGRLKEIPPLADRIDNSGYRDKTLAGAAAIMMDNGHMKAAFEAGRMIETATLKAKAMQSLLNQMADPDKKP